MTRRFLLPLLIAALTLTAVLAASAPASAAQLDLVGGSTFGSPSLYPYQQWADDSYAPTYPGAVQLMFSPAPLTCGTVAGAVGCTNWSQWPLPQVEIDTGYGPYWTHAYLMHELGHVFDATEMQDPFRADFMTIWGLPGGASAWWTPFGSDHGSPGEWFAESYRLCALYGPQMPYKAWTIDSAAYDFPGDRDSAEQNASCRLILSVGAADGLPTPTSPTVYSLACSCKGTARRPNAAATTCCCLASRCGARGRAAVLRPAHGPSGSRPDAWARRSSAALA